MKRKTVSNLIFIVSAIFFGAGIAVADFTMQQAIGLTVSFIGWGCMILALSVELSLNLSDDLRDLTIEHNKEMIKIVRQAVIDGRELH